MRRLAHRLLAMASHGLAELGLRTVSYAGQRQSTSERMHAEHRIKPEGKLSSVTNWWVLRMPVRAWLPAGANMSPLDGTSGSARARTC